MKQVDVHTGGVYVAKVSGKLTKVRLDEECWFGTRRSGWLATNLATGRQVHIRSAAKLRKEVLQIQPPFAPAIRL
jgi:hypothetical protein